MELMETIRILWSKKWVLFFTTVVTTAIVATGTFATTPIYTASTTLRAASHNLPASSYSDYVYVERLLNTYVYIATSRPILEELSESLGLEALPVIKAEILTNTELIQISVESGNPHTAAEAANKLAMILVNQSKEIYSGGKKSMDLVLSEQLALAESDLIDARSEVDRLLSEVQQDSQAITEAQQSLALRQEVYSMVLEQYEQSRMREAIRENMISIVEPAIPPSLPSRPRLILNILLGTITGLAGGILLALSINQITPSIRKDEENQLPSLPETRI